MCCACIELQELCAECKKKVQHTAPPAYVKGYNAAFVGNIPWELDKQAIADIFRSFQPTFVRMFDDPTTGKHKGFAHIHFGDASSVHKCALSVCCQCDSC
jgi:hypothetical protein